MSNAYQPLVLTPEEFQEIAHALNVDEIDGRMGARAARDTGREPRLTALVKLAKQLGFRSENGLVVEVPAQVEIYAKGDIAYGGRDRAGIG